MNFEGGGALVLNDAAAEHVYIRAGGYEKVGEGKDARAVRVPKMEVSFRNHVAHIRDPAIAGYMMRQPQFGQPWGFYVDRACLPDEQLRETYLGLQLENQRAVVLALIDGAEVEEAIEAIDTDLEEKARKRQSVQEREQELSLGQGNIERARLLAQRRVEQGPRSSGSADVAPVPER